MAGFLDCEACDGAGITFDPNGFCHPCFQCTRRLLKGEHPKRTQALINDHINRRLAKLEAKAHGKFLGLF